MIASIVNQSPVVVLYLTAAIMVQQCLTQEAVQDNFLLVAARPNLYQIDLRSGAIVSLLATPKIGLVAVVYDPVEMAIYWTDVNQGLIGKNSLNGLRQESTIIYQNPMGAIPLDGLALDIGNRKLYYADAGETPKIVEINLDGSQGVSIANETGLKPRALVLDTDKRALYYTDWGVQPGIYVIDLRTHQNTTILKDNLVWPNALAIDFEAGLMYWADAALFRIEMANIDGSGRTTLVYDSNSHYYALALGPQFVYITDWNYNAVKTLDRKTHILSEQRPNISGQQFGVAYYNSSFTKGTERPGIGKTTLEPDRFTNATQIGTEKLGIGKTTPEPDRFNPVQQIDYTTIIIAVSVAGGIIVITGMITISVCCVVKRKRASAVAEPHYATAEPHYATAVPHYATLEPHYATTVKFDDRSTHDYESVDQYI